MFLIKKTTCEFTFTINIKNYIKNFVNPNYFKKNSEFALFKKGQLNKLKQ